MNGSEALNATGKYEKTIHGRHYIFDGENREITVDGIKIDLQRYEDVPSEQRISIYVCECSPDRNPITVRNERKDIPTSCKHIRTMKRDNFLTDLYMEAIYPKLDKKYIPESWSVMLSFLEPKDAAKITIAALGKINKGK